MGNARRISHEIQAQRTWPRRRALIVNVFLDEYRRPGGSPQRIPRAMAPVYLAGAFAPRLWDLTLYNEQYSGLLEDFRLLKDLDFLVLTGLTASFDRMRQLTAYARSLNPKLVVAAGGPAVRALPKLSKRIFDYACLGDIEELQEVLRDSFGSCYVAEDMKPRYDLNDPTGMIGYVESSRNCNFGCSFCSLTGEKVGYRTYDIDFVADQIEAVGKKQIGFIDNNFYGSNRKNFLERVALCKRLYDAGKIKGWSCLVTADFFARKENLELAKASGCKIIFSGVESFDSRITASYGKKQNAIVPQVKMIQDCLESGILFSYGVMLDPTERRLTDLRAEIDFILDHPEISLPAYFTLAIPLLGTPYFHECVEKKRIFPNTLLRNLEGVSLTMYPLDDLQDVLEFVSSLTSLRGYRRRVLRHTAGFLKRYRKTLDPMQLLASTVTAALIATESFASAPMRRRKDGCSLTYYGPNQELDPCYRPAIRIDSRFADLFSPLRITDANGDLHEDVAEDCSGGVMVTAAQ